MDKPEITWRLLPEIDWHLLEPIFDAQNWRLPDPQVAFCVVGEIENQIVSVRILQPILHAEPAWDHEDVRGRFDPMIPAQMLEDLIDPETPVAGVLVITTSNQSAAAAKQLGFERIDGQIWGKDVSSMRPKLKALAAVADFSEE